MRANKRKVLMISYIWPPMEGVGLIRALKFAKYLPEYGWEPLILTVKARVANSLPDVPSLNGIKVFRTDYRDVIEDIKTLFCAKSADSEDVDTRQKAGEEKRSAPSFMREFVSMPDEEIGWYKYGIEEGKKIVAEEKVDLIFSTSPPETSHLIARRLKRYYKIPWVADLRDLWADDHFRQRPLFKKMILSFLEKRVLKDADSLVTVSEPWAATLCTSISSARDKVTVIENGYDDEDFDAIAYGRSNKLTLTYTGKLHKGHQDVSIFFKVLRDLIEEGRIDRDKIDVKFYVLGYDRPDLTGIAGSYGLGDVVKEYEKVGYNKSLEIQRSSDVLLFVQWRGEGGDGWYSAKLYDYIGAQRPILALAKKGGIVEDLLKKTSSGIIADSEHSLRETLLKIYGEYIKNGCIKYDGVDGEISKHTRKLRTKELANLFDSLVAVRQQ